MTLLKGLGTGLCLTLLCVVAAQKARADELNHETTVTFSAPVEVPGVGQHILPPGTYVFKLLDSLSDRHIVQIFNADKSQVLTTVLAVPNYRLQSTGKTVMTFSERPAGDPETLKAWFYPDAQWGEHFVYEKSRAVQLAKETNEAVLSTSAVLTTTDVDALKAAPIEAVSPTGDTVDTAMIVQSAPATEPQVVVQPATVSQVALQPAPPPVMMASLPKTASNLPLIALFGLLTLTGGFVLTGLLKLKA